MRFELLVLAAESTKSKLLVDWNLILKLNLFLIIKYKLKKIVKVGTKVWSRIRSKHESNRTEN